MRRIISTPALLFASVSAILGSGWLFTAYYTASLAGPAAILAWVLGGAIVIVIAFVFAELTAMLPITGSSTRIPQFTHGSVVSFVFAWMIWLSYMALTPTEVQAVIQYLSFFRPGLVHHTGALTQVGYLAATALMLVISAINTLSLRWLIRCNNVLTVLKIAIPCLVSFIILAMYFSMSHELHPGGSPFMPFGFHGVLAAMASGGILFAFNGFKQACEMAGEAEKPQRALPIAIIGSVLVCLVIYLLLQSAFLTSLTGENIVTGWGHLHLAGGDTRPLSAILVQDNLSWLLPILYVGAIIGPLAAAFMYMGSASRSLYGQSKNDYLPIKLQTLNSHGNPSVAIAVNFIIGMCMFAPLPGWDKMISYLTSLMAISYAIAPVCLLALRKQVPKQARPFRLPFAKVWSTIAFYFCTLLSYFSGWEVISKLGISLGAGLVVLLFYHYTTARGRKLKLHWRQAIWLWPYLIGLSVISYFGNYGSGLHLIPVNIDLILIAVFCVVIVYLATYFRLPAQLTKQYIKKLNLN